MLSSIEKPIFWADTSGGPLYGMRSRGRFAGFDFGRRTSLPTPNKCADASLSAPDPFCVPPRRASARSSAAKNSSSANSGPKKAAALVAVTPTEFNRAALSSAFCATSAISWLSIAATRRANS